MVLDMALYGSIHDMVSGYIQQNKSFAFKLSMHSEKSKGGHVGHIGVYMKKKTKS